jgi:hypothetical protein
MQSHTLHHDNPKIDVMHSRSISLDLYSMLILYSISFFKLQTPGTTFILWQGCYYSLQDILPTRLT